MPSSKEQFEAVVLCICNKISITPYHRAFVASLCMPFYKNGLPIVPVDIAYMLAEMTPIKKLSDLEVLCDNGFCKVYRVNSELNLKVEQDQRLFFTILEAHDDFAVTFFVSDNGTANVVEGKFWNDDGSVEILGVQTPEHPIHPRDRVPNQPIDQVTASYAYITDTMHIEVRGMRVTGSEMIALGDSNSDNTTRVEIGHGSVHHSDLFQVWQDEHPYIQIDIFIDVVVVDGVVGIDVSVTTDNSAPVKLDPSFKYWSAVKSLADRLLVAIQ